MHAPPRVYLIDTNAIIEAVRTRCWHAITGGLRVETVEECRDECQRGERLSTGVIVVTAATLARLSAIHPVTPAERAALLLTPEGASLDPGERDLFAHAIARADAWLLCSPDHASVDVSVARALGDRMISLGELVELVGARPAMPLRPHFESTWLNRKKTEAMLRRI